MEALYRIYKNIQIFITEYRKMEHEPFMKRGDFILWMQKKQHLIINCKKNGVPHAIILFTPTSRFIKVSVHFRRIMTMLNKNKLNVYLVSQDPVNIYIAKLVHTFNNLNITLLQHRHFIVIVPRGPLCSEHTILTDEEAKELCGNQLYTHPAGLPSISVRDPQCIWIGAEVGQIVRIKSKLSANTGSAIRYRLVVPENGFSMEQDEDNGEELVPSGEILED